MKLLNFRENSVIFRILPTNSGRQTQTYLCLSVSKLQRALGEQLSSTSQEPARNPWITINSKFPDRSIPLPDYFSHPVAQGGNLPRCLRSLLDKRSWVPLRSSRIARNFRNACRRKRVVLYFQQKVRTSYWQCVKQSSFHRFPGKLLPKYGNCSFWLTLADSTIARETRSALTRVTSLLIDALCIRRAHVVASGALVHVHADCTSVFFV